MTDEELLAAIQDAMWDGDINRLDELAGCGCCCDEHFFEGCPANFWGGCRGSGSITRSEIAGWMQHYGMTPEEFYNVKY